jgi:3',5'-cyclic-AMP phosphodiesterase
MAFVIAQITDLHISDPDQGTDLHYQTADHLERCVARLNSVDPRPDIVVATGDLVDKAQASEYERLRGILGKLEMPFYLLCGNHDSRENLLPVFDDHDYLPRDGFLQYSLEDYPIRIVCCDTRVAKQISGTMCDERLTWLDQTLAADPDRPTVVFVHHPPFTSGLAPMDKYGFVDKEKTEAVIRKHPQVVRVSGGHLHRPVVVSWGGTTLSVCPGVAHQIALNPVPDTPVNIVMEPPAYQLHMWQEETGLVTHTMYVNEYEVRTKVKIGQGPVE